MYLLDTDITSNLLDARRSNILLRERVRAVPLDELAISIVTLEEILRGVRAPCWEKKRSSQNKRPIPVI